MKRPSPVHPFHSSLVFAATVALATIVAACGGVGDLGTIPPASPTAVPSASPTASPPDITPAPSSDSPQPSGVPSGSPSGRPGASPTPRPTAAPETIVVRAYFLLGPDGLVPVLREVPKTAAVGSAAMDALLRGPSATERSSGIASAVPAGTQLLGLTIRDGTATVDLSREFESGGGSASMRGRLAQVVYTLTQFPSVDRVTFMVDGRIVTVFSGEGIALDGPQARADFEDQLPAIWVDRPAWGASLGNPGRVTGLANVFEAAFRITLLDGSGRELVDVPAMATCGTGCWGTFDVTLRYSVAKSQWGTLRVWNVSARDGTPEDVREYRVWLTPAS